MLRCCGIYHTNMNPEITEPQQHSIDPTGSAIDNNGSTLTRSGERVIMPLSPIAPNKTDISNDPVVSATDSQPQVSTDETSAVFDPLPPTENSNIQASINTATTSSAKHSQNTSSPIISGNKNKAQSANIVEGDPNKIVASHHTMPASPFVASYQPRKSKPKRKINFHIWQAAVLAALLIIAAAVTGVFLPNYWSNSYLSKVTPAYNYQSAKMLLVYEAFARPVFSSNNSPSYKSDMGDYAAASQAINAARVGTNQLQTDNQLTSWPSLLVLSKTKQAEATNLAMNQYIKNSQNLLNNFSVLIAYLKGFETITYAESPMLVTAVKEINNATTRSQLIAGVQNLQSGLTSTVTTINDLHPPAYLSSFNTITINDCTALAAAAGNFITAVNNLSVSELSVANNQYTQASNRLVTEMSINMAGLLQNHSPIHSEIIRLESENPLGIKTNHKTNPGGTSGGKQTTQATNYQNLISGLNQLTSGNNLVQKINKSIIEFH